ASTILGPGRLIASLTTAILRFWIACIADHPGFTASASTSFLTFSDWLDAKTKYSGCSRTASSKLYFGQSCCESTTEVAPLYVSKSAINVFLPIDCNGAVHTTKNTRFGGTYLSF